MSKIKSKETFKERDEIEEYFSEVKNKSFPVWILFFLLLLLVIGGFSYYYFIIDSPKNIFLTVINNNLKVDISTYQKINYEFNLDTNIKTNNKKYIDIVNIVKEIALSGSGGIDLNTKENISKLNTFYKGEKLLDIDIYSKNSSIYLKLHELYDKVIKIDNEETNKNTNDYDIEILINSLNDEIKFVLNKATYKKEYTKLNDGLVKKVTLFIDKSLTKELYTNLLNNKDFIDNYSKLSGTSKTEVKKEFEKEINNLDDSTKTISLYLSILKNDFIMLETINEEQRLIITKEENQYDYKIYDNSLVIYQGYIYTEKTNNEYEISLSLDVVEEELSIILNLDLSFEYDNDIELMDITNTINYEDLTKFDKNKIINNILKNKTILSLIKDINSLR